MRVAYMGKCMGQTTDYSYRLHSLTHCQVHSFIASFLTVSRQLSSPLAGFSCVLTVVETTCIGPRRLLVSAT